MTDLPLRVSEEREVENVRRNLRDLRRFARAEYSQFGRQLIDWCDDFCHDNEVLLREVERLKQEHHHDLRKVHGLRVSELEAEVERLQGAGEQIDHLARYIMEEVPGEPSRSEGAGDTAIRLLERLRKALRLIRGLAVHTELAADPERNAQALLELLKEEIQTQADAALHPEIRKEVIR